MAPPPASPTAQVPPLSTARTIAEVKPCWPEGNTDVRPGETTMAGACGSEPPPQARRSALAAARAFRLFEGVIACPPPARRRRDARVRPRWRSGWEPTLERAAGHA